VALELTQPLTEMSTSNISWRVKGACAWGWQPYHIHMPIVLKSGSLNLLEPSGPVQACNGIPLPFCVLSIAKNVYDVNSIKNGGKYMYHIWHNVCIGSTWSAELTLIV